MRTRLTALLLAIAMLAPTEALGAVLYLCQLDGQARTSCCCKSHEDKPRPGATLERGCDCCDVQVTKSEKVPAKLDPLTPQLELPAFVAILPAMLRGSPRRLPGLLTSLGARAPPLGLGPPLSIRNCSFLI